MIKELLPLAHPTTRWQKDALQLGQDPFLQLRLAAMAGHMRLDKLAARRAALIDLLADGCPHPREEIWEQVAAQVGKHCWGKRPQEALLRDLKALRQGNLRIGYSRRPEATGYYLQDPPFSLPTPKPYEALDWSYLAQIRQLSVSDKNQLAFSMADFALRQKQLITAETHPNWSATHIEQEARQLVFGSLPA